MEEVSKFGTFENKYPIAKIRYRILAFLIDFFIYCLLIYTVGLFFGEPTNDGGVHLTGFPAFLMMGVGLFLWPVSEGVFGQTIGKRFLNIQVVNEKKKPAGMGQTFGRFFIGFFDYMFLAGIIIAYFNKENKRLGDIVANTLVIQLNKNE